MTIQSTITVLIEIVFWATLLVLMTDFVNGLFDIWYSQNLAPVSAITPQLDSVAQHTVIEPQFEAITDPWKLPTASENYSSETQSIVLPLPTLRLLPAAKEVQQPKRRGRPKKFGDSIQATTPAKSPQKRSRTRKKWFFSSCYAKLLVIAFKETLKMYLVLSKTLINIDI